MPAYTIHDLPQEDRPRERLREVGVDNLSIQELLALIIERGKKNMSRFGRKRHVVILRHFLQKCQKDCILAKNYVVGM